MEREKGSKLLLMAVLWGRKGLKVASEGKSENRLNAPFDPITSFADHDSLLKALRGRESREKVVVECI